MSSAIGGTATPARLDLQGDGSPGPSTTTSARVRLDPRLLIAPLLALLLTVWLDPSYTSGDPSLYRYVYDAMGTERLGHGFFFYSVILNSTEPLHYLLIWTLTHLGLPREVFIGGSSAVLAFVAVRVLMGRGAHILVATTIVSSSFYFLLLYTTTERLKIAVIFLFASLLALRRTKLAIALALMAVAAHAQVIIIYVSVATIFVAQELRTALRMGRLSGRIVGTTVVVFAGAVAAYLVVGNQVAAKAGSYAGLGAQAELLRVIPFYVATLFYTRDRLNVTLLFLPLLILTPIIGYGRLNLFSYFILLYYSAGTRKGFNLAVLLTTLYFCYSSYTFVERVIAFGDPDLLVQ